MKQISYELLDSFENEFKTNDKARIVKNALTKNDLNTISRLFEEESQNIRKKLIV